MPLYRFSQDITPPMMISLWGSLTTRQPSETRCRPRPILRDTADRFAPSGYGTRPADSCSHTDCDGMTAERFRRQAARALRLAQELGDPDAARRLHLLAADYMAKAEGADAPARPQPPQQQQPQATSKAEE
jgi:hypothetical protein